MSTTNAIETAARELTPDLLDLMEHEKAIEQSVAEVGWHLQRIRDGRKYRAAGYSTFEDYCQQRWGMSRQHVNRQIKAAETIAEIEPHLEPKGSILPTNETQVRPLAALPTPEAKADVWQEAVERAGGGQPTAAEVATVVEERRPKPVPKPAPKVGGERVEGAPPHPAVYSDAVLHWFRDLLAMHHDSRNHRLLDPFAGTGRIHELRPEWSTVGVELELEWARLHGGTICGDSTKLDEILPTHVDNFGIIATSPAYGNRLADHYDAYDPEARRSYSIDLGRPLTIGNGAGMQWGEDYRTLHETVWRQCVDLLAPGGLFLLNCKDHQRDGEVVQVTGWHVRALVELGLAVIDVRTIPPAGLSHTTAAKLPELIVAFRKPSADNWVAVPVKHASDANEQFAMPDHVSPDAAEAQAEQPITSDLSPARAERIHGDAEFKTPEKLQRSPWPGYRAAKDHALVAKIGRLKDPEVVRHVVAYEWGGKNLRRAEILAAALARLDELAAS